MEKIETNRVYKIVELFTIFEQIAEMSNEECEKFDNVNKKEGEYV